MMNIYFISKGSELGIFSANAGFQPVDGSNDTK